MAVLNGKSHSQFTYSHSDSHIHVLLQMPFSTWQHTFYRGMHVVLARYCYCKSSVVSSAAAAAAAVAGYLYAAIKTKVTMRPCVCTSVCLYVSRSVCNVDVPWAGAYRLE